MAKSNLNRDGGSKNYLQSIKKGEPAFRLDEIYREYLKSFNNIDNAVLLMSEIHTLLREYEIKNESKNFKMIFHHQGTTWFANEIFFIDVIDKKQPKQITTKADGMAEIIKILHDYNERKLGEFRILTSAQRKLKNRFENKLQDIFQRNFIKNNKNKTNDFAVELNKLIKENRYDFDRLEVLKTLAQYKYLISDLDNKNYVLELLKNRNIEINADYFASHFSFNPDMRKKLMNGFDKYKLSLNTLGSRLAKSYENAFNNILKEGYNSKEIESVIRQNTYRKIRNGVLETTNSYNNRVKTLSRTFSHGIDNLINFNQATEAGMERFEYVGSPVPERDFCKEHLNKTYTLEEIEKLDNGQHLNVMTFAGGYNCRHFWLPVG